MNLRANPTPAQARGQREKDESVKQSQVRAPNNHIFRICSNNVWHASVLFVVFLQSKVFLFFTFQPRPYRWCLTGDLR